MANLKYRNQNIFNTEVDLSKVDSLVVENCEFVDCRVTNCEKTDVSFGAGETQSKYINCIFDNASFSSRTPGNALFKNCSFVDVVISDFNSVAVEFEDCIFSGVIERSYFNGSVPEADVEVYQRTLNSFSKNTFSSVSFLDVGFSRGIDLSNQKFSQTKNCMFFFDAVKMLSFLDSLKIDSTLAEEIESLKNYFEYECYQGQTGFMICKDLMSNDAWNVLASSPDAQFME